jgi:TetR/AcrR family tetracycline transcriptional repressor
VSATSIYWHVGNKEQLLDAVVDRIGSLSSVRTSGRTPERRVSSTARSLLASLQVHGSLVALAHQQGRIDVIFNPARRVIAEEFAAAGLRGAGLADVTNAVVQLVAAYSLTEAVVSRSPVQPSRTPIWDGVPTVDAAAARRLETHPDPLRSFEVTLEALVAASLQRR